MKLVLVAMLLLVAAASYDAHRSRRRLAYVAMRCMDALEVCAHPTCTPIGWHP